MQRQTLAPQEARVQYTIKTNEEAFRGWQTYHGSRLSEHTLRNYAFDVRMFIQALERPAWEYRRHDMWSYLDLYLERCKHHQWGAPSFADHGGSYCRKGQDVANCGRQCPVFESRTGVTVQKHLQAIVTFYDFLVRHGLMEYNFVRDVRREYSRENPARRVRRKHVPSMDELKRLIAHCPGENRRAMYVFMAKTGARIGEAIRIPFDEHHVDLDEGWARVPEGGKRRGNPNLIIDKELRKELEAYLKWRDRRIKCDALFVNWAGRAFDPMQTWSFNKVMRKDHARAGLSLEKEITPHALRHFFSDHIKRSGIDPYWWNILRGDVPRGNEATYVHPTLEDIRRQYNRHAPHIGAPGLVRSA